MNPHVPVTKNTPPTFLLQNQDDHVDPVEHSLVYYRALRKAGVPAEMHLYSQEVMRLVYAEQSFPSPNGRIWLRHGWRLSE